MKKIALINDLSGMGKCSLTAAIPVLSVMGVQACPLPTAVLSSQTGYKSYFCMDCTDQMDAYMKEWQKLNFHPDGVFTGYLADESQADKILQFLEWFAGSETVILVDPVMGDRGETYAVYTEEMGLKMRQLARRARVITPNLTEALLLLYGREGMHQKWREYEKLQGQEKRTALEQVGGELCKRFELENAVITGIELAAAGDQEMEPETETGGDGAVGIGNLIASDSEVQWITRNRVGGSYSGTGDLFASVLIAGLVQNIPAGDCVRLAADFLEKGIRDAVREGTDRNDGICFETYLTDLGQETRRLLKNGERKWRHE